MDAGKKGAPSPTEQEFCLKEGVWLGKTSGMDLITFENNGTVIGQGYVVDQCSVKSKEKMTLRQAVTIARELNSTAYDATIASYHHSLYPKDTNSVKGSDSYPYSDAHKIHGRPSVKAKQIAILTP